MSSVLSLFWSSKPTPAAEPVVPKAVEEQPSASLSSTSVNEEKEDGDEFILVDSMSAQTPKNMDTSSVVEAPVAAAAVAVVAAPVTVAAPQPPASASRTCRPYGHAHSPPALLAPSPAMSVAASISTSAVAAPSSSSSSSSSSKRSFASVACSTPSASSTGIIAYAASASISLAEQLRAKIDQLSAEVAESIAAAEAEEQEAAEEYTAPKSGQSMRLPLLSRGVSGEPSQQIDDAKFDWALGVEEPRSKRPKRTAASANAPLLLSKAEQAAKLAKRKAKPHKVARKEDKEMRRAREDKEGTEISSSGH